MLGRFELAMGSLGIVLLVTGTGGSFAAATAITGAHAAAGAVSGPLVSRLIDRRGQRRILLIQVAVYLPAVLLLIACVLADLPLALDVAVALVVGTAHPPVSSLVRARWSALLRGSSRLRTAYAWESMVDAAVIALGAPLATVLCVLLFPAAAVLVAMVTLVVSAVWLAELRDSEPPPVPVVEGLHVRGVPEGILAMAAISFFVGSALGAFDIAAVARAADLDRPTLAGWTLAVYAIGSTLGGTVFGRLRRVTPPSTQYVVVLALLVVGAVPILLVHRPVAIVVCAFASGVFIAPTIIAGMTLTEAIAPLGRVTESLAWVGTGFAVGRAFGEVVTGNAVDHADGRAGLGVVVVSALLACVLAVATVLPVRLSLESPEPLECGDLS